MWSYDFVADRTHDGRKRAVSLASGLQLVGAFQVSSNFLDAEFPPAAQ
jgi:hypothetical protein